MYKIKKQKKAFTLVELIVVIAILAILGTIAFISLGGYNKDARDGKRLADLGNIKKALEFYSIKNGKYPEPTKPFTITYSGYEAWTQGTFGDSVLRETKNISKVPLDPLTGKEYTYSLLNTDKEFQVGSIMEGEFGKLNTYQVNADGTISKAYISGNYNGTLINVIDGSTGDSYILAVPSIITSDLSEVELVEIVNNNKLVFEGNANLPASYSGTTLDVLGGEDQILVNSGYLLIFQGDLETVDTDEERHTFLEKLQAAYTGTVIENTTIIEDVMNVDPDSPASEISNYVATLINTNLGLDLVVEPMGAEEAPAPLEGWRALDSNCTIDDIVIGTQTWAGCNSTLGDGSEWGKKSDGSDGMSMSCYYYDGTNYGGSKCPIGDSNMASNISAKNFFDLKQPGGVNSNGDAEYDTIWGKFYTWEQAMGDIGSGACRDGRHLPSDEEWYNLEVFLGGTDRSTDGNYSGIRNGFYSNGLGWNSESGAKARSLSNLLKMPLAGSASAIDWFSNRGRSTILWSSNAPDSDNAYSWSLEWNRSTVYRNVYFKTLKNSVRCIKD